ncbi:MAG: hypothetical protein KH295_10110 [Clostridiaceae bacterium]|nr:hypothetical protein [Clostridiaceae bacterium]
MQNEVLRTLCILSATGAVLTLAVYALAPLARRFLPARWLKNAATLVLLAYALPVWLALPPLSALLPARSAPQAQDTPPAVAKTAQTMQAEPMQTAAAPEPTQQPVPVVHDEAAAQPRPFPSGLVLAVWGAGAALMLCRMLVSYAVFRHRLKAQSEPVEVCALLEVCRAEVGVRRRVRLYRTALVRAPALAGLVRPVILLPWGDFSADDLRAALLHELHHLKSRDLARKWLAALVQCAHWWNPFAYLAARLLHRSCETACDLAVTGKMDSAGRAAYMKAVLAFAAAGVKAPPLTTSMSAGGREIERRFIMIARQKPVKLFARLTALALTACLLVSGLGVGAVAAGVMNTAAAQINISSINGPMAASSYIYVEGVPAVFPSADGSTLYPPIMYNGSTYIPLRTVGNWMGKNVSWDNAARTVTLYGSTAKTIPSEDDPKYHQAGIRLISPDGTAELSPEITVSVDGQRQTFRNQDGDIIYPLFFSDAVYLPLRSIGELTGYEVTWYEKQSENDLNAIFLRSPLDDAQIQAMETYGTDLMGQLLELDALMQAFSNTAFTDVYLNGGVQNRTLTNVSAAYDLLPQIKDMAQRIRNSMRPQDPPMAYYNEQISQELDFLIGNADGIISRLAAGERPIIGTNSDEYFDQRDETVIPFCQCDALFDCENMVRVVRQNMDQLF